MKPQDPALPATLKRRGDHTSEVFLHVRALCREISEAVDLPQVVDVEVGVHRDDGLEVLVWLLTAALNALASRPAEWHTNSNMRSN